MPFSHPLVILFSSGKTGMPKCIVHSAAGTLAQQLKEHRRRCTVMSASSNTIAGSGDPRKTKT
ncbi:AMP-binding domain-containing protein [Rhizobium gallicum bv. gallicum R602sp]|uniref:AMP-binding domain-containing protein n=1 Tax=Rhizobium gallicum bv. gallicum R602sp TaxID=1041138 RepID=A0A0B4X7S5_9HYPH|nr:AMP-binding domain-containing protein [Rhizobium gallicum bv. gallicum R602sp]